MASVGRSLTKPRLWRASATQSRVGARAQSACSVNGMDVRYDGGGGVYANMFDAGPPFQIDANFGITAAIGEMLLQSRVDKIELLARAAGCMEKRERLRLRARGGFQVDMLWQNGKLITATIHSDIGGPCSVSYAGKLLIQNQERQIHHTERKLGFDLRIHL